MDAEWVKSCDLLPRCLTNSRKRTLQMLLGGVAALSLGVLIGAAGSTVIGVLTAVFGTCVLLASILQLIAPPTLTLNEQELFYRQRFGMDWAVTWRDCESFHAVRFLGRAKMLGIRGAGLALRQPRSVRFMHTFSGIEGMFPNGTGGLPVEALAVLLNRYLEAYARPAEDH